MATRRDLKEKFDDLRKEEFHTNAACATVYFLIGQSLSATKIAFMGTAIDLKIILQALSQIVHMQKVMSNASNTMKKREKLQSKGQQEKIYKQDVHGTDTELSKGAESERERSTKRPGTGA